MSWQAESWGEYATRTSQVAKRLAPGTRYGTYHRTWLLPGNNDDIYNGCETRLSGDQRNCGACGNACDIARGQPCVAGVCRTKACEREELLR